MRYVMRHATILHSFTLCAPGIKSIFGRPRLIWPSYGVRNTRYTGRRTLATRGPWALAGPTDSRAGSLYTRVRDRSDLQPVACAASAGLCTRGRGGSADVSEKGTEAKRREAVSCISCEITEFVGRGVAAEKMARPCAMRDMARVGTRRTVSGGAQWSTARARYTHCANLRHAVSGPEERSTAARVTGACHTMHTHLVCCFKCTPESRLHGALLYTLFTSAALCDIHADARAAARPYEYLRIAPVGLCVRVRRVGVLGHARQERSGGRQVAASPGRQAGGAHGEAHMREAWHARRVGANVSM